MDFFTSDHHFFHKNIIEYCDRPYSDLDEMHADLINKWNSVVGDDDNVYILGDFSFGKPNLTKPIIEQLHGNKVLVKGNHDHGCHKWGIHVCDSIYFAERRYGVTLFASHYPYAPLEPDEDYRFLDRRLPDKGHYLLHGHVHQNWKIKRKQINVGVDMSRFFPMSIEEILRIIRSTEESALLPKRTKA